MPAPSKPKTTKPLEKIEAKPQNQVFKANVKKSPREKPHAIFTYVGGNMDHEAVLGKHERGRDGKPVKRTYKVQPSTDFFETDQVTLFGIQFDIDNPVLVCKGDERFKERGMGTLEDLVRKAKAMGVFDIESPDFDAIKENRTAARAK